MAGADILKERKFHDAWAFYLFIIFTIVMDTIYIVTTKQTFNDATTYIVSNKIIQIVLSNFALTLCLILLFLLLSSFAPKALVIGSVLTVPAVSIYYYIRFKVYEGEFALVLSILIFAINLIFLIIAGIVVLVNLEYVSQSLSIASKIFFQNFLSILGVQFICFFVLILLMAPAFLADTSEPVLKILAYASTLLFGWTATIISLFMEVFVSSVVFFHIKNDESGIFGNAFNNSLYALGSISFGALLVAIVFTLKSMIADAKSANTGKNRSIATSIFLSIAEGIVSLLGDVIQFANSIAFPYLSVTGTKYSEAVAQSFQVLTSSGLEKIAAYYSLDFVIITVTLISLYMIFNINNFGILPLMGAGTANDNTTLILSAIFTAGFGFFFYSLFALLKSAVMSLIYATAACPSELKGYCPEFVELVEKEKKKHVPADASKNQNPQ